MTHETSYKPLEAQEVGSNETAAAVIAGIEIAGPQPIGDSDRFFTQLLPAGGNVKTIDLEALEDELAPHPRRKTGTVHVQDADSFIAYIEKHRLPGTEVFADMSRMKLVGIINAHSESSPADDVEGHAGHADHRVSLELLDTDAWKAWTSKDKTKMEQVAFAEHLEDNAAEVIYPDAATMLEIAQSFQATTAADFKSAQRIDNGTVGFRYEETQTARAGQVGELEIPSAFTIGVAPFEGADKAEVIARFRYRISNGHLTLSYALLDPTGVKRQAFLDHVDAVRGALDLISVPVFQGRPE